LLACARAPRGPAEHFPLDVARAAAVDWDRFIRVAARHHVTPVASAALARAPVGAVPPSVLERLHAETRAIATANLGMALALARLLARLEARAIRAIPVKGPTLAVAVYGGLGRRAFADIDLLVHEDDYASARALLSSDGCRVSYEADWETHLVAPDGAYFVDLHRRAFPTWMCVALPFDGLWARRAHVAVGGARVPHLAPDDLLLLLAGHVAKDAGEGKLLLVKVVDVAEFVRAHAGLDWGALLAGARARGCERMVLFALRVASVLTDVTLPEAAAARLAVHRWPGRIEAGAYELLEAIAATNGVLAPAPPRRRVEVLAGVRERFRDRARVRAWPVIAGGRHLLTPNERDRAAVPLPSALAPIHYLTRPVRLLWTYGVRRAIAARR
jgi:hypothetical protein